jgi:diguanylate cyclase (GGDEF)-like protein
MAETNPVSVQRVQLKGFSRTMAELEWLLLILVILYYVSPGARIEHELGIVVAMSAFALFVLAFRYANFFTRESRWKLAIESWVMILFITYVSYNTGGVHSPLLNLYLMVLITSALTLGKVVTILEFLLIATVYLYMGVPEYSTSSFTAVDFSHLMTLFAPFLLITYVTTMLAADVNYGMEVLRSLSETDDLTGLNNRRSFVSLVKREAYKAARYGRPYSIMMIDIDNLKSINDRYGHAAGDNLIKAASESISDALRESDFIARLGGDEFIVLLTETDYRRAGDAGERIKTAMENTSLNIGGAVVSVTISIGISSYPDDSHDLDEIMKFADEALYQSKQAGRNTVTTWHDMA